MKKRIGTSLSLCIAQILEGYVKEEDVEKIITNTKANSNDEWEILISDYCDQYWRINEEEARAIFYRLLQAGKIEQPRLNGGSPRWNDGDCWE
jgi:hypothetical protein